MAYTTIDDPTLYFNTKLYSGTSGVQTISGIGFEPSWIWTKSRTNAGNHQVTDQVRGLTKYIRPNAANAEDTKTNAITAVNSDGFVLGADSSNDINASGQTYASWLWRAGTTSGIATNGSTNITPSGYSFNQTSGFSAIAYTGTAVDGAYLPHGLGKAPELLLLKSKSLAESWQVYSAPTGNQGRGHLDNSDAFDTSRGEWYSYTPDSVNMRISNDSHVNSSGATYIAYFFTSIQGYSKIGSYVGNGNADGAFIYTGFKPAFVMIKYASGGGSGNWTMYDNKRLGYNVSNSYIYANETNAESSVSHIIDLVSTGFKCRANSSDTNTSGGTMIYMAFAEAPLVGSNNVPANAR